MFAGTHAGSVFRGTDTETSSCMGSRHGYVRDLFQDGELFDFDVECEPVLEAPKVSSVIASGSRSEA